MEYLGLDICMEILSRLGVKDLIRLKCVSKTFLDLISSLISSDEFIRLHLNKSSFRAIHLHKITYLHLEQHGTEEAESSLRAIHIDKQTYLDLYKQQGEKEVNGIATISRGSFNGLVCLYPTRKNNKCGVVLWNPALRKAECVPIKRPLELIYISWFGYDNDEYKLILGTASHIHLIRLYTDTDAWKSSLKIDKAYSTNEIIGTLVHRTVHWAACYMQDYKHTIISYDLRNETVGRIAPPDVVTIGCGLILGQVDGCLSTMFTKSSHVELWVMKQYGVEKSWTKLMILPSHFFSIHHRARERYAIELDDPAQLSSPFYGKNFYVESLIFPRSIQTKMC